MSIFTTASSIIPEYKKFAHICVAIKDKQFQQGLNAPAFASIRAPLLDFEKPLIVNDSEGYSGSVNKTLRHLRTSFC